MNATIYREPAPKWSVGSRAGPVGLESGLKGKWIGEGPSFGFRTRSFQLAEPGSPRAAGLAISPTRIVESLIIGGVLWYIIKRYK